MGRQQTRGQQKQQPAGPVYSATMQQILRQAARLPGVRQEPDEGSSDIARTRADIARAVREKSEWARLAQADRAASDILDPPQEGDSMSTEAAKAIGEMYKGAAEFQRAEAEAARRAAADLAGRADAARAAGAAEATAAANAKADSTAVLMGLLVQAITGKGEAEAAAARAQAGAEAAAANARNDVLTALLTTLLPAVLNQRQAPVEAPDPKKSLNDTVDLLKTVHALFPQSQPVQATPSAADYATIKTVDAQIEALKTAAEAEKQKIEVVGSFLNTHGGPVMEAIGQVLSGKLGGGAAQPGGGVIPPMPGVSQ